jgi:hypothetical protein
MLPDELDIFLGRSGIMLGTAAIFGIMQIPELSQ